MRTFVISDAHGHPELIENALDHGEFEPGRDAFVYAGDLLDRGPDAQGCFDLVDRYATEVLLGNHEVAVLLAFPIWPQDWESLSFRPLLIDRVLNSDPESAWKAATCSQGVLITHAGISSRYQKTFDRECRGDPWLLAAHLNVSFLTAIRQELETGEWDEDGILGDEGPLWLRPGLHGDRLPLAGIPQVAGHTPPIAGLEEYDFSMIDPCAWLGMDVPGRCRYAVIEEGRASVVDATPASLQLASCEV